MKRNSIKVLCGSLAVFFVINAVIITSLVGRLGLLQEQLKQYKPVTLELNKNQVTRSTGKLDIDHDGEDEVVVAYTSQIPNSQNINVYEPLYTDYEWEHYGDISAPLQGVFIDMYYNKQTDRYVYRFLEAAQGTLLLREIDNNQDLLGIFPFEKLSRNFLLKTNWFKDPTLVDIDGDGDREMLIILQSIYPEDPRGMVCFDFDSRQLVWEYYSGAVIDSAIFQDLNGDGRLEIILSTFAAYNNIQYNGTGDNFSYVIVLNGQGREVWRQTVGGSMTYARTAAADLDEDGKYEIVVASESYREGIRGGGYSEKMHSLDAGTGAVEHSFSFDRGSASTPYISRSRVYVGDSEGYLRLFDKNLAPIKKIKRESSIQVLNDSLEAQDWRFIYTRLHNRLLVFDRELNQEISSWRFPVDADFDLKFLHTKKGRIALLSADRLYLLKEAIEDPGPKIIKKFAPGLALVLIVLVLFNGFIIFAAYRAGGVAFFFGGKKREEKTFDHAELQEFVQGITHKLKNHTGNILRTAEKIIRDKEKIAAPPVRDVYAQLADLLLQDVEGFRKHTQQMMKLIRIHRPEFAPGDPAALLENLAQEYRNMVGDNVKITVRVKPGENISIPLDAELFKSALLNILDSVVAALPPGSEVQITIIPSRSIFRRRLRRLSITIAAPGGRSLLEKLSGVPLEIARLIIQVHGGIFDVKPGKGPGIKIALNFCPY